MIAYSTRDDISTEEAIEVFMHDCSQITLTFVLVKPSCTKLVNEIVNKFREMNFLIAYQRFIELDHKKAVEAYIRQARSKSELERKAGDKEKTGVFTGVYAVNPVNGGKLPVYVADYVLMEYGSGAVMGVPGHDKRDWEFAKKYKLSIRQVVQPVGAHHDAPVKCYEGEGEVRLQAQPGPRSRGCLDEGRRQRRQPRGGCHRRHLQHARGSRSSGGDRGGGTEVRRYLRRERGPFG
mgnify:CR=1 FL=1